MRRDLLLLTRFELEIEVFGVAGIQVRPDQGEPVFEAELSFPGFGKDAARRGWL